MVRKFNNENLFIVSEFAIKLIFATRFIDGEEKSFTIEARKA